MSGVLSVSHLTKFYGLRPVLRNLSLDVAQGEFVAILGPNGAGKTTLLRILATLMRPESGSYTIDGIDALQQPLKAREMIGLVSHQSLLYQNLTAYENLVFYAQMYGVGKRQNVEELAKQALQRVDLLRRAHDLVRTYSRGMLQRLTIARAILHEPALVLLDEPYTGLDQASARRLSELLEGLAVSGRTVVMTTHEYYRGINAVNRAIFLSSGQVSAELRENITPDALSRLYT